jgi:hypothetical protein
MSVTARFVHSQRIPQSGHQEIQNSQQSKNCNPKMILVKNNQLTKTAPGEGRVILPARPQARQPNVTEFQISNEIYAER